MYIRAQITLLALYLCIAVSCTHSNEHHSEANNAHCKSNEQQTTLQMSDVMTLNDTLSTLQRKIKYFDWRISRDTSFAYFDNIKVSTYLKDTHHPEEYVKYYYQPKPDDPDWIKRGHVPTKDTLIYFGLTSVVTVVGQTSTRELQDTIYLTRKLLAPYINDHDIDKFRISEAGCFIVRSDTLIFKNSVCHSSPNVPKRYDIQYYYIMKNKTLKIIVES